VGRGARSARHCVAAERGVPALLAEFNARFGIATYTDLPANRFDEAVQFVQAQYRALTGDDLPAGIQERLL